MAFVLGFVLLGVGSGSTGLSDVFQNAFNFGSSSGTSIGSLAEEGRRSTRRTRRRGATSRPPYEQKQRTQDAVNALERYTALRPKDQNALGELASQYTTLVETYATDYQNGPGGGAAVRVAGSTFAPAAVDDLREDLRRPERRSRTRSAPLSQTQAQQKAADRAHELPGRAEERRGGVCKKLAKLTPTRRRPSQYPARPGRAAAGDYKVAVAAYQAVPEALAERRRSRPR